MIRDFNCITGLGVTILTGQRDNSMDVVVESGLIDLYPEIFAAHPYHELFSAADTRGYFEEILIGGGNIFLAQLFRETRPPELIAFAASVPLLNKPDIVELLEDRIVADRAAYFAEDAVREDYRRQGISGVMKSLVLEYNGVSGYNKMVLRTSADSHPQIAAVEKAGGRRIAGVTQDVLAMRLDGRMQSDGRIFFEFDI